VGFRFFTVYGPWGRPDMAAFIFTDRMMRGQQVGVICHCHIIR
jgi:UDP-glucuronate 4-epimerase